MLRPILLISESTRYQPLFVALNDLGIRAELASCVNLGPLTETKKSFAAIVIDWGLPAAKRAEALRQIYKAWPDLQVISLGYGDSATARRTAQSGNHVEHLAMTGNEKEDLILLLEELRRILPDLRTQVVTLSDLFFIKTPSRKMVEILSLIDIMKDESSSVLIQGETGTGKEVIARLLHYSGRRHAAPFVAINCAAIPETLLESELFGHEKGSFTGAFERRIGKFELAHNGAVLLDEIGDMPLHTQAKILRVLESGEIERVGGHEKIKVDVRIVAATNKKLFQQIDKGLFRQDLYYRINTFTINLPPLRERLEDVLPLAKHFIDLHARRRGGPPKRLSPEAEQLLLKHDWPGNVRELRNAMERAMVLAAGNEIGAEVFPDEIREKFDRPPRPAAALESPGPAPMSAAPILPLEEVEKRAILDALSLLNNNATKAAKHLSISKATLFRKLKQYGFVRRTAMRG
ncbi:MAG: sigma-54-dependent Fis family transcriptional regulator [Deltaproteobacteria bacterium]|nr:sigma-54-dependent Fis family transcriptional regulator [Deltaproteobacteria bacterium]